MKYWKLRVDLSDVSLTSVLDVVQHFSDVYCYCLEDIDSDNPHTHFYFEVDKSAAVRTKLRALGLKGNSSYSLKELDERYPIEYIAYLLKQGRFTNSGVPGDIIQQASDYDSKVKAQMKDKKESRKKAIDRIIDLLDKEWLIRPFSYESDIKYAILKYHVDNRISVRKFQLQSYWDTIVVWYSTPREAAQHIFGGFGESCVFRDPI